MVRKRANPREQQKRKSSACHFHPGQERYKRSYVLNPPPQSRPLFVNCGYAFFRISPTLSSSTAAGPSLRSEPSPEILRRLLHNLRASSVFSGRQCNSSAAVASWNSNPSHPCPILALGNLSSQMQLQNHRLDSKGLAPLTQRLQGGQLFAYLGRLPSAN